MSLELTHTRTSSYTAVNSLKFALSQYENYINYVLVSVVSFSNVVQVDVIV